MRAQTEILFSRWVTLTEHKWVIFRERRSLPEPLCLLAFEPSDALGLTRRRPAIPVRDNHHKYSAVAHELDAFFVSRMFALGCERLHPDAKETRALRGLSRNRAVRRQILACRRNENPESTLSLVAGHGHIFSHVGQANVLHSILA